VNRFLIEEMASTVSNLAGSGELAFDLYAGVGLFAGFLSDNFTETIAIEANAASARDLESVAAAGRQSNTVHNKPASLFLADWKRKRSARIPDAIVVDPPRAGLESEITQHIAALRVRKLVYVSCDPSTLARDLAKLWSSAYTLRELHLFDMFPQTYHIESVVFLERTR
jgi:23S rRNA (uracil1939-C5)-methyltransferase